MASLVPTIIDKEFQNWLRGALALLFTKQGLDDFVLDEITQFQKDLLANIFTKNNIPVGTVCNTCTTENVLPCPTQNFCSNGRKCKLHNPPHPLKNPNHICPNNICKDIKEAIRRNHRCNGPSWKNTDASKWCTNAMEIAKCYMAPDGYLTVTSIADTDFNGVLAVIINNKRFQNKMAAQLSQPTNICTEAREVGHVIRHSAELSITDTDLAKYIDSLIDLLSDQKHLTTDNKAQVAVNKLKQLKSNTLTVTTSDVILVIGNTLKDLVTKQKNDSIQVIDSKTNEAQRRIEEKTNASLKLLGDFKDSLTNMQTLTINQISATKVFAVSEIENISKNEKQEVSAIGIIERRLVNEEIKTVSKQEKEDISATLAKQGKIICEEIQSISEKGKQVIVSTGTKERQFVNKATKSVTKKEKQKLAAAGAKEVKLARTKIRNFSDKKKKELTEIRAKERQIIREQYRNDSHGLRQDLINFYRTNYSAIPIAPLVEEHEVPLVEFYVQPPLTSVHIMSRQLGESQDRLPVHSYRDLFLSGNGDLYKNIYITAKAGIGKTSFSKRICMVWCQAHNQLQSCERKFQPDDLKVMKQFDFLFFLPLREADLFSCDVDNMIYNQIINSLEGGHRYTECFVRDVLSDMTCLIVLDGLDEWTHPESCKRCRNVHEMPHRPAWERCSIVTTTRPWKLDVTHVSLNQIDIKVEINELDEQLSKKLISNAISLLNELKLQRQAKSVEEFQQATSLRSLAALRYTPYILLQMICLWFDGTSVGKSKCEVYSNILELTFVRGLMKTGHTYWSSTRKQMSEISSSIPACVVSHESCRSHFDVIHDLGKLAFTSLFTLNNESILMFPKAVVLDSISEDMLTFLLKIGLLSQNKDYGHVASRQSNFSFQHKSLQEYFAALYIHSKHEDQNVQERICQVCNSLASILEMSNVFIFLGGFSSEAFGNVWQVLHNIVASDITVTHFRTENFNFSFSSSSSLKSLRSLEAVKTFQDMQTDILQEILATGQRPFSVYIEDIIIQYAHVKESCNLLKSLILNSQAFLKSVFIEKCSSTQEVSEMLDSFGLRDVNNLQKLTIFAVPTQPDLKRLLTGSVHTLMSCEIVFIEYNNNRCIHRYTPMASENIEIILNMKQLQSLKLLAAGLTHSDIKVLFDNLSKRTEMTGICLRGVFCTTHKGECDGHSLDLSQLKKLNNLKLHLGKGVIVSKLCVNTSSLEYCFFGRLPQHVYPTLFKTIFHATELRELGVGYSLQAFDLLKETLPHLPNVSTLIIRNVDLGDGTFTLPTQMKNLDSVILSEVTMTSAALKILSDSADILPQPIRSLLRTCTVNPEQEYQQLKGALRSSHKCRILFDGLNNKKQSVFDFQTVSCDTNK